MSTTKLSVTNLSWNTTDETLRQAFSAAGQVIDATVLKYHDTGRPRGSGFVTFSNSNEANTAIEWLNNTELDGRVIKVSRASNNGGGDIGGGYGAGNNNQQGGGYNNNQGGGGYDGGNNNQQGGGYYDGGYSNQQGSGGYDGGNNNNQQSGGGW